MLSSKVHFYGFSHTFFGQGHLTLVCLKLNLIVNICLHKINTNLSGQSLNFVESGCNLRYLDYINNLISGSLWKVG